MINSAGWFYWALLSAIFAALTAIFAKVGIQGVDSDLATLIRTAIIIVVLSAFVAYTGKWANPLELSPKTWLFLGLSGLATGASWVCYFRALKIGDASKVAPVDKLSLVAGTHLYLEARQFFGLHQPQMPFRHFDGRRRRSVIGVQVITGSTY